MPDTFDADHLRASLKPLAQWQPLSDEAKAYQRFYQTDFPERDVWRGMGRFEVDGYELVSHCWWPEKVKGTLFLLHGFYDHTGLYRHVIEWALDQDFAVIACDLPGHGLSSGPRASIRDFSEYQDALQALFAEANSIALPQPWHLCGQSTGGAIVVDHVLNHGEHSPAQGQLILLAPLVRPRAWGWSQLSYYLLRPFVRASPGASARTPMTRHSCRSCKPTRYSPSACRRRGSVLCRVGSSAWNTRKVRDGH